MLDVHFNIRHGFHSVLWSVAWKVLKESMEAPIIGRPVLESIGCDNRAMLAVACDLNAGIINVTEKLSEDRNADGDEGTMKALLGESIFHKGGQIEFDDLEEQKIHVESGDDLQHKLMPRYMKVSKSQRQMRCEKLGFKNEERC